MYNFPYSANRFAFYSPVWRSYKWLSFSQGIRYPCCYSKISCGQHKIHIFSVNSCISVTDQEQQIHAHQWEELLLESCQASALEESVQWTHTTYINFFLGWLGNLTCGFCIKQYFLHTFWASRFLWFEGLDSLFHTNKALKMCHAFSFCSKVTSTIMPLLTLFLIH